MRLTIFCYKIIILQQNTAHSLSLKEVLRAMYLLSYLDGGTLIYTSIKNNSNLNTLYEYILHRSYKMPLRFKQEIVNE